MGNQCCHDNQGDAVRPRVVHRPAREVQREACQSKLEANGEDGEAWFELGSVFDGGKVGEEEMSRQQCFEKAAALGHARACYLLGREFEGGDVGGKRHTKKQCYEHAASLDHTDALIMLGLECGGGMVGSTVYTTEECFDAVTGRQDFSPLGTECTSIQGAENRAMTLPQLSRVRSFILSRASGDDSVLPWIDLAPAAYSKTSGQNLHTHSINLYQVRRTRESRKESLKSPLTAGIGR